MSMWKRWPATAVSRCCFISRILAEFLLLILTVGNATAEKDTVIRPFPLEMDALMGALNNTQQPALIDPTAFPRTVDYR